MASQTRRAKAAKLLSHSSSECASLLGLLDGGRFRALESLVALLAALVAVRAIALLMALLVACEADKRLLGSVGRA